MSRSLTIVLILIALLSCNDDDHDRDCPRHCTCKFELRKNAELTLDSEGNPTIKYGKGNVFVYSAKFKDNPRIADDELTEQILVHVSADSLTFNYTDLKIDTVYYTRMCYCFGNNTKKIEEGYISGSKNSEMEWTLSGDVHFSIGNQEKNFKFTKRKFTSP